MNQSLHSSQLTQSNRSECCCPARSRSPIPPNLSCDDLSFLWRSGFEVTGEALLLTASNKASDFAVNSPHDPTTPNRPDPIDGNLRCIRPGYEWGFRVNAVGTIPRDRWRISTSFVGWEGSSSENDQFSFIYGTFLNPGPAPAEALRSSASLINRLYFLDVGLSRILPLTRALLIEPGIFVRFLKFDQKLAVTYTDLVNEAAAVADEESIFVNIEQRYRSLGPRFGINLLWHIWSGFFLTGKVGIVPLYGKTDLFSSEEALLDTGVVDTLLSASGKSWYGESMIETGIGLVWRNFFKKAPVGLEIFFSWEQWQTSSFGDILFFNNAPTPGSFQLKRGDICFQGIAFGAGLQF